jgi:hypothetical protein
MKRNFRCNFAAFAAAPLGFFALAASAQTINLGDLSSPTVPNGYQGFNWDNAPEENQAYLGVYPSTYYLSGSAAMLSQFSRSTPFDLSGTSYQNWVSEVPDGGGTSTYATTIDGYRGGTLVNSVTENYSWGNGNFTGINMNDVTKVTFSTIATLTDAFVNSMGQVINEVFYDGPDQTFVGSVTVGPAISARAPEIDPASAVSAFTLLGGALLVLSGRRKKAA